MERKPPSLGRITRLFVLTTLIEWALKLTKPGEDGRALLAAAQVAYCRDEWDR